MDFSDEMIDEIFDIFQVESEEIISKINNNLLILEKKPNDKEAILSLFRDAHSLKGASRMIGLNDVQLMAHRIEDILGLAKEDKIFFNFNVISALYSVMDFLTEFIKKCIKKKKQIYSEEFSKYMEKLEKITDIADEFAEDKNDSNINKELLLSKKEDIDELIIDCLCILMILEVKNSVEQIKKINKFCSKLLAVFSEIECFELKNEIENVTVKLNFLLHASCNLTMNEINEIHSVFGKIIKILNQIYEINNIKIIDYYGEVFKKSKESNFSEEEELKEIIMPVEELELNEDELLKDLDTEIILSEDNILNDNIPNDADADIEKIIEIKKSFDRLSKNDCSVAQVRVAIKDALDFYEDRSIKNILNKCTDFLDFSIKNETHLNDDVFDVVEEGLNCCIKILDKNIQNVDSELIMNRLTIVRQVLDLSVNDSENELQANVNQEKIKKVAEITDIFNTGEIKTLRVDSHKLDGLISQVNELTIEKIKIKKHLIELLEINKDSDECQKNLSRVLGFLNYNEKKLSGLKAENANTLMLLKQLINIITAHNKDLQKIDLKVNNLYRHIQENDIKMDMTVNNISAMVKNIRILPFGTIFHLFGRMVRDIAQEKGKKIDFEIAGSDTCADKKIIEEIKAPLIHIIRNSIDHGIELQEEREALGKPATGKILLSAYQTNNKVIIEIVDDGRGINLEKIKEKALSKGFLTPHELESMDDEQITSLIFAPGFSTGDTITDISGRGIGLDVVQTKIAQLNGKVRVISNINKGCCTQIILPTTMSILNVFVIQIQDQYFAIPIDSIDTVLRKSDEEIIYKNNKKSIIFENDTINLFKLSDILNISENTLDNKNSNKKHIILIIANEDKKIAISVEKLIGEQEIMHKKLAAPFYKLKYVSGITTLVSGDICLILNINDILNNQNVINVKEVKKIEKHNNSDYKILLVDDSITTITLEKAILTKSGYRVELANNPIEAFELLKRNHFDLIITDFEMPEMDGLTFLKHLKSDEMYADIPAIMMSSLFDMDKRKAAIAAGACKYIVKGEFDQDTFQRNIKEILQG